MRAKNRKEALHETAENVEHSTFNVEHRTSNESKEPSPHQPSLPPPLRLRRAGRSSRLRKEATARQVGPTGAGPFREPGNMNPDIGCRGRHSTSNIQEMRKMENEPLPRTGNSELPNKIRPLTPALSPVGGERERRQPDARQRVPTGLRGSRHANNRKEAFHEPGKRGRPPHPHPSPPRGRGRRRARTSVRVTALDLRWRRFPPRGLRGCHTSVRSG